jgi:hypothetical protein
MLAMLAMSRNKRLIGSQCSLVVCGGYFRRTILNRRLTAPRLAILAMSRNKRLMARNARTCGGGAQGAALFQNKSGGGGNSAAANSRR